MRRALVTGAAGFVGRHFTRRLVTDGWAVDVLDVAEGYPEDWVGCRSGQEQQDARDFFRGTEAHSADSTCYEGY